MGPTMDIIHQVEALGLKRGDKKDWVVAYDWRLLEDLLKVEKGVVLPYDPWRRRLAAYV